MLSVLYHVMRSLHGHCASILIFLQGSCRSGKTGKSGIFVVRESHGKIREKYYFEVRENDFASCRVQISVILCVSKY